MIIETDLFRSKHLATISLIILFACSPKDQYQKKHNTLSDMEIQGGWRLLFDGQTTDNWRGVFKDNMPEYGWVIVDNTLSVNIDVDSTRSGASDIITIDQFGNFDLKWEWRLMNKGDNSGLKYYYKEYDEDKNRYDLGLEYQLLDDSDHEWMLEGKMKPNDYHTMGALYELYAPLEAKKVRPLGEWNTSRILSVNNHVEHWLNGEKILEYERGNDDFKEKVAASKFRDAEDFGLFKEGHILLQNHGGALQVRNIKIKELD